jgi:phosphatidylserine/phosphatidylglycerophosphate/cardiolipin synthase-like enzyme
MDVGRVDDAAGALIERLVVSHHRRRLGRLGQGALDVAPAGATGPAARPGNELRLLVDGTEALPAIEAAIASARSSVWLAGWAFSPRFRLSPGGPTLRDVLAEAASRVEVRVLAWAGAPLPLFKPTRSQVRAACDELARGTAVRVALDGRERPLHCHHEKLVVVDGEAAFVGGIDLTDLGGDRLDTSDHPTRGSIGWHDAAVRIRGPAVADVAAHFALRWAEITGAPPPPAAPAPASDGDVELRLVRTVPERIYRGLPRGEFTIVEAYLQGLRAAERFVYLENQFLWSPELTAVLADKLRHPPDDRFRLVLLLPVKPNNGRDDTRGQLGVLAEADRGAGRLLACTLYQRGPRPRPVYVHAKVAIVDDRWLAIGSANLNEHSLFNDTEVDVVCADERVARGGRLRLWSEHLERGAAEVDGDPAGIVDGLWRPLASEQLRRLSAGEPLTHRLVELPGVSRRVGAFRGPLNGLVVDA